MWDKVRGYSSRLPPTRTQKGLLSQKIDGSTDSYTLKMFCFNQLFSTSKEECKFSGKILFADLMYFEKSTTIIWVFGLYSVSALSSYAGSLVKDRAKRERGE